MSQTVTSPRTGSAVKYLAVPLLAAALATWSVPVGVQAHPHSDKAASAHSHPELATEPASAAASVQTVADDAQAVPSVIIGKERVSANGKRKRVSLVVKGSRADDAAGMRLWLSVESGRIGKIKLQKRIRDAGFSMNIGRKPRQAIIVVSPPVKFPLPVFGEGRVAFVKLPKRAKGFAVSRSEFGSTKGLPMEGAGKS